MKIAILVEHNVMEFQLTYCNLQLCCNIWGTRYTFPSLNFELFEYNHPNKFRYIVVHPCHLGLGVDDVSVTIASDCLVICIFVTELQAMNKIPALKELLFSNFLDDLDSELSEICGTSKPSLLRNHLTPGNLEEFVAGSCTELKKRSPTLSAILPIAMKTGDCTVFIINIV